MTGRAQFGPFVFDPASGELWRDAVPVRLQPQPGRVLAILVERAGTLVSRDELQQQIWSDGTSVDFERGLNFCIAQLRSALGDSADAPRYIETAPKRGYRFVAPVTPLERGAASRGERSRRAWAEACSFAEPSASATGLSSLCLASVTLLSRLPTCSTATLSSYSRHA